MHVLPLLRVMLRQQVALRSRSIQVVDGTTAAVEQSSVTTSAICMYVLCPYTLLSYTESKQQGYLDTHT